MAEVEAYRKFVVTFSEEEVRQILGDHARGVVVASRPTPGIAEVTPVVSTSSRTTVTFNVEL